MRTRLIALVLAVAGLAGRQAIAQPPAAPSADHVCVTVAAALANAAPAAVAEQAMSNRGLYAAVVDCARSLAARDPNAVSALPPYGDPIICVILIVAATISTIACVLNPMSPLCIDPTGDVWVAGLKMWDCPPYDQASPARRGGNDDLPHVGGTS